MFLRVSFHPMLGKPVVRLPYDVCMKGWENLPPKGAVNPGGSTQTLIEATYSPRPSSWVAGAGKR